MSASPYWERPVLAAALRRKSEDRALARILLLERALRSLVKAVESNEDPEGFVIHEQVKYAQTVLGEGDPSGWDQNTI